MKCPKCGAEHYRIDFSSCTLMNTYTEYNNGKFIHHDPNITTDHVTCSECGEHFEIKHQPDNEPFIVHSEKTTYAGEWNVNKDVFKDSPTITLENQANDSIVSNTASITVASSPCYKVPEELVVNCDKITLRTEDGRMVIVLDSNMDYNRFKKIVINGITYERVKERDDSDDYFLKCNLGL